ncbi:MAG: M28 family peptidase, partial [Gemmatimonadota bacterium]
WAATFDTEGAAPSAAVGDSMQRFIRVLADDSMMGRRAGTADELRAAQYLASNFEAWGLTPLMGAMIEPFGSGAVCGFSGSRNVLGVVPGSGALASEWVVVGGHYDALGTQLDSTGAVLVRNGADDNASGTAMMLELARLYSRAAANGDMAGVPRRAVLFAGFGAEERGLIGSCEFIQAAIIDPAKMAGMVNFDMVGRLRNNTVIAQTGGAADAWDAMLANTNVADLVVNPFTVCKACSDYYWFGQNDVPYVWFFTGDHADYHRPTDDENLIDYDGMVAIGSMAYRILIRLAITPGRPIPAGGASTGGP